MKIYFNGQLVEKEDAKVSVFDHGLLYGDGVFEGIRVYNGRIFRLEAHMERLMKGLEIIRLEIPISRNEFRDAIVETVRANNLRDAYIRAVVTRGVGDLGLSPRKCKAPTLFVIADRITLYPKECYEHGLDLITAKTRRLPPQCLDPNVKSMNYLVNIMAKVEALDAGTEEAIMLTLDGYVAECTGDNIYAIRDRKIVTPPVDLGVLPGITRGAVFDIAAERGIPMTEGKFTLEELLTSDEVFLTGTAAEIVPVKKIDGHNIGDGKPGKVTGELMEGFHRLTAWDGTPVYEDAAVGR